jgi:hypothetical protein
MAILAIAHPYFAEVRLGGAVAILLALFVIPTSGVGRRHNELVGLGRPGEREGPGLAATPSIAL